MLKFIIVMILCITFFCIGKFDLDSKYIVPESKKIVKAIDKNTKELKKEYSK
jgi:hypothetical protein